MASARDTVYAALRARLLDGYYPRDASLIPNALSDEFQVSRTPVREALGLLEQDGLLVSASRGFSLRQRTDEEMLEIFEVRGILESSAAVAAASRRTPIDLARMRELVERSDPSKDQAELRVIFNEFHSAVLHAAHNATISALVATLTAQIKMGAPWTAEESDESIAQSIEDHQVVLAAITEGDGEKARTRMLEHLARDRDRRIDQLVAKITEAP